MIIHLAISLALVFLLVALPKKRDWLSQFPGPFLARHTRLWKLYHVMNGNMEQIQWKMHQEYGSVVRISPDELVISDPAAIAKIYGRGSGYSKTRFYSVFGTDSIEDLFTELDERRHAHHLRRLAPAYQMSAVVKLEPSVDVCTRLLCSKIGTLFADQQKPMDIAIWLQYYAFDVIGEMTFSRQFGFMGEQRDIHDCMAKLERYLFFATTFSTIPDYWPAYSGVMSWLSRLGLVDRPGVGYFAEFVSSRIKERLERSDDNLNDFVTELQKSGLDDAVIFVSCFTNVVAGGDTTAISLRSVLYFLMRTPTAYRRLQAEVDTMAANGQLSDPVTFSQASRMPYLQAVLKEAMRMHPAVQLSLPRRVPEGGLSLGEFVVPAGAEVGMNPYVIHRDQHIFGDDVHTFRPERWLESEFRSQEMERHMLQFGTGPRVCVGKHISLMEMSKLIPELLRHFDFELVEPQKPWITSNYWFAGQKRFDCVVTTRSKGGVCLLGRSGSPD